jgi:hypothetical protein
VSREPSSEEDERSPLRRGVRAPSQSDAGRHGSRRVNRLSDYLSPADVRDQNLFFHEHPDHAYDRVEPDPLSGELGTFVWIRDVPDARIREMLEAVDDFTEHSLRAAWSWYMALSAGLHFWPDANHRTGQVTFAYAAAEAFNLDVALAPRDAEELVLRSKAWRNARVRRLTAHELSDPEHPYRELFKRFEDRLDVERIT